jgi:hypothetical protein
MLLKAQIPSSAPRERTPFGVRFFRGADEALIGFNGSRKEKTKLSATLSDKPH